MDFAHLQDATARAGYTLNRAALIHATAGHPEPVLDWIAAAGEYLAADAACGLLTRTAAALRDQLTGTAPGLLYQYADQLAEICDQLTHTEQARDEAMVQLSTRCLQLAALDPVALRADPDGTTGAETDHPVVHAHAYGGVCRRVLPPRPRRLRRRPPATGS